VHLLLQQALGRRGGDIGGTGRLARTLSDTDLAGAGQAITKAAEEMVMKQPGNAGSRLSAPATLNLARSAALALPSALVLGVPSAGALPVASGSKCSANWVNNEGALACFIQGEEDLRNGVAHPHYVACTTRERSSAASATIMAARIAWRRPPDGGQV